MSQQDIPAEDNTDGISPDCQLQKLSDQLYACLAKGACQYAVTFGKGRFCKNKAVIQAYNQANLAGRNN
jgi:hypothetical protein